MAPLTRRHDWDDIKGFSKAIAESFVQEAPQRYTATMWKPKRKGKIFIDYFRNHRGATTVAAYSSRAAPDAPVDRLAPGEQLLVEARLAMKTEVPPCRIDFDLVPRIDADDRR